MSLQPTEPREEAVTPSADGENNDSKTPMPKDPRSHRRRSLKLLAVCAGILLSICIITAGTFLILYHTGQDRMLNYEVFVPGFSESSDPREQIPLEDSSGDVENTEGDRILTYDDGKTVTYQGETYVLNENITTTLLIGVDRDVLVAGTERGSAGEADCILLMSMDTETGETKIVNISREAYAQVDIYSASEIYIESRNTQLCRAFAYGDGRELSCENTIKSVKRLLYGMPIHSYVALDLRFIGAAADAVGGVTLTTVSDVKMPDKRIVPEGTEIELWGEEAERYVRYRNKKLLDSNLRRMDRQKQFVQEFAKKALQETKRDLSTLLDLYKVLSQYMTTNLSLPDVTFLLGTFLNHGATFEFDAIQGELGMLGENAVYYLDETNIYETVLDLYYTKAE